jgi:hypothetical protein
MGAFFSGTDNRSELTCPGFHVVIGNISHKESNYTFASSIVLKKMRKEIDLEEVVDTAEMECEFHEDVLDYIDTVVSKNKKLYEAKQTQTTAGPSLSLPWSKSLVNWSDDEPLLGGLSSERIPEAFADLDADDIDDIEDLDMWVDPDSYDPNFPYHEELVAIVDSSLDQGYRMLDILLSLRKAKNDYDLFSDEQSGEEHKW